MFERFVGHRQADHCDPSVLRLRAAGSQGRPRTPITRSSWPISGLGRGERVSASTFTPARSKGFSTSPSIISSLDPVFLSDTSSCDSTSRLVRFSRRRGVERARAYSNDSARLSPSSTTARTKLVKVHDASSATSRARTASSSTTSSTRRRRYAAPPGSWPSVAPAGFVRASPTPSSHPVRSSESRSRCLRRSWSPTAFRSRHRQEHQASSNASRSDPFWEMLSSVSTRTTR